MTTQTILRRFLLPTILLGAVVAVLSWEPSHVSPGWKAQVTTSSSSAVCGNGVRDGTEECDCYGEQNQWTCNSTTRYCDCPSPIGNGTCTCVNVSSSSSSAASVDCAPCTNGGCQTCAANAQDPLCGIPLANGGTYECLAAPNANYTVCTCPAASSATSSSPSTQSSAASQASSAAATSQSSSAVVSSQTSSAAVSSQASSVLPPQSSFSSAGSAPNGSVIGIEAGLCAQVKADPVTGQKLVYCCLDEGFIYQREASQQEFEQFVSLLKRLESMSAKDAKPIFDVPYDGSIHRKYGWTSLCGKQIPCDVCSQDHICGNGVVEATEKCDDGPRNSAETPDVCRIDCTLPKCGDSVIDRQAGEECDDGRFNGDQPNRCRTDCVLPRCGDAIIDSLSGETCDTGRGNSDTLANSCRSNCQSPRCGDGVQDSHEDCDDGNRADSDGCSFYCELERRQTSSAAVTVLPTLRCGNGITEPGEECDTGSNNANVPNNCRQNCILPRCGDRIQDTGEECDDGNNANGDGCTALCMRELVLSLTNVCGNQIIDPGEECDAGSGNANIPDHCRFDCRFPTCGDGIKDTNEQCDDRNHLDGDGCTKDCFSEFCGDGFKEMGEECDDGNLISGDGCSRLCQKDTGTPVSALIIETGSLAMRSSRPPLRGAASSKASTAASSKVSTAQQKSSARMVNPVATVSSSSSASSVFSVTGQAFSIASSAPQMASTTLNAQVIPFPAAATVPVSAYYYPQQPVFTTTTLNDTGPAALSIVAMGAAAGLAWARRKRRM